MVSDSCFVRYESVLPFRKDRKRFLLGNLLVFPSVLRMSPALTAGVIDRLWSAEDLVALWEG
jgi:hypothetical protein